MPRLVDNLIVFRILRLLTIPFNKQKAFELGIIDEKGNRNKEVDLDSTEKKNAYTYLHRLVFNLKKIIEKVPFGKTRLASYAVALALLKEEAKLDADAMEELCEKVYHYVKDEDGLSAEEINEGIYLNELVLGGNYYIRRRLEQNDKIYEHRTSVNILESKSKIFGVSVYKALHEYGDIVYITGDDVR